MGTKGLRYEQKRSGWTADRVERLKELWAEGLSARAIARALGGITRSGVCGKIRRLGLAVRTEAHGGQRPPRMVVRKIEKPSEPAPPSEIPEPVPAMIAGNHVTVLTIRDGLCRWPCGDPAGEDFHFCAARCGVTETYCEFHKRRAFVPQMQKRTA